MASKTCDICGAKIKDFQGVTVAPGYRCDDINDLCHGCFDELNKLDLEVNALVRKATAKIRQAASKRLMRWMRGKHKESSDAG